jgi:hypothetical protein
MNQSFVGQHQIAWDSTSLGEFKTCPRKYYFSIIQGWSHKILPPPLAFGLHFHKVMETYYKLLAEGQDQHSALLSCVRLAGELGETISLGDNTRTKETLIRSIVWYIDQFQNDPAKTVLLANGRPAVEYSFAFPFTEISDNQIYLCGHIDRLVKFQNEVYATDYKTTKQQLDSRFFSKFKPDNQMLLYMLATHVITTEGTALPEPTSGIIVDGIQLGVNFTRFQRQVVPYSPEEVEEFAQQTIFWVEQAYRCADAGIWPANEKSCDMYYGCQFREVCKQKPAHRELALKSNFAQRPWNPLETR